jgi:hypothetical protein
MILIKVKIDHHLVPNEGMPLGIKRVKETVKGPKLGRWGGLKTRH